MPVGERLASQSQHRDDALTKIMSKHHTVLTCVMVLGFFPAAALAQAEHERPYFVTYDHYMEELGALEIGANFVLGRAKDLNTFLGNWTEFEYGARRWWTTEFYLDTQHTRHEGSLFTGMRFENRFRLLTEDHAINPVLYVEYEHLNGADKTLREVVGFDSKEDLRVPNSVAREKTEHEIETKLILSSEIQAWNLSENFIAVKNLHEGRWEFGYAVGVSRPLKWTYGRNRCAFCRESFTVGAELYGGLGEWGKVTLRNTSQYIATLLRWNLTSGTTHRISPGWGLTDRSVGSLIRFGVAQEIDIFGHKFGRLFRGHRLRLRRDEG